MIGVTLLASCGAQPPPRRISLDPSKSAYAIRVRLPDDGTTLRHGEEDQRLRCAALRSATEQGLENVTYRVDDRPEAQEGMLAYLIDIQPLEVDATAEGAAASLAEMTEESCGATPVPFEIVG